MTTLTTLTVRNNIHRAYYSDGGSLIISKNNAEDLSKAYNIRIENDEISPLALRYLLCNHKMTERG